MGKVSTRTVGSHEISRYLTGKASASVTIISLLNQDTTLGMKFKKQIILCTLRTIGNFVLWLIEINVI
jgi:hypothetical protein